MADIKSFSGLGSSMFMRRVDELSSASDRVWLVSLAVGLGLTIFGSTIWPSSINGKAIAYLIILIRMSLYFWAGDALKGRGGEALCVMLKIGIVAGMFELLVDWGLIHWISNGRLVYLSGNDVVLLGSPIWMPFAWATVIGDMGYFALRVFGKLKKSMTPGTSMLITSLATGVLAGFMICVYEYFAYNLGWWKYEPANVMLGNYCAIFIPVGEIIMFISLLPIISRVFSHEETGTGRIAAAGAQFACFIAIGYTISYLLLEFGRTV